MQARRQPYILLAAVILLWGANWPIMKVGLDYISPIWFASIRLLLGSACLFTLLAARGDIRFPDRLDLPVLLSVSFLQLGVGLAFMHIGLTTVEAGRSAILSYTTPIWVTPLAVFILGEKVGWAKALGLALGISGVAVLFNPIDFDYSDKSQLLGNGYLVAAAVVIAVVIVHVRHHRMIMTPLQIMPWQTLIGGICLTVPAYLVEGLPSLAYSPSFAAIIAYNGLIASGFCFWAYQTVMRELPATSTSLGSLGIPVAG